MDLGIAGKAAFISGGSKGIGKQIARMLLAEGVRVTIAARTPETLEQARDELALDAPGRVHAVSADMTDLSGVRDAVQSARDAFGPIDIAVSNVIGTVVQKEETREKKGPKSGHFADLDRNDFNIGFRQLVMSAWYLAHTVLPDMRASGWGRIINIGSKVAREPKWEIPHVLPNMVRPGVAGLHRSLADAVFADGITVNNALTGSIATERNRAYMGNLASERGKTITDVDRQHHSSNAIKRPGTPEEMASLVLFWCSRQAGLITGQSIAVDGGQSRHIY